MNLALPAVLVILGMLPGIVFFHSYYSGRFTRPLAGISATSEAALYIVFAIPLNLAALAVFGWYGFTPKYDLLARLLIGTPSADTPGILGEFFKESGKASALLYLSTLCCSLVLGNLCRRFVWAARLDVHIPFVRLKHEWFYTITGRLASQPRSVVSSIDIMVDRADGTALYQGWITHVEIGKDGNLEQLVLDGARRGKGRGAEFEWKEIPGDRFVVTGDCVHSINLRYISLAKASPTDWWAICRSHVRAFLRSFAFQEP